MRNQAKPCPLLCPQPPRAPTSLRLKVPSPPVSHKPLPSPPPSLPLPHSAQATQASSLFPQHTKHSPAPGPLHAVCLLPGKLFCQIFRGLFLLSIQTPVESLLPHMRPTLSCTLLYLSPWHLSPLTYIYFYCLFSVFPTWNCATKADHLGHFVLHCVPRARYPEDNSGNLC